MSKPGRGPEPRPLLALGTLTWKRCPPAWLVTQILVPLLIGGQALGHHWMKDGDMRNGCRFSGDKIEGWLRGKHAPTYSCSTRDFPCKLLFKNARGAPPIYGWGIKKDKHHHTEWETRSAGWAFCLWFTLWFLLSQAIIHVKENFACESSGVALKHFANQTANFHWLNLSLRFMGLSC